MFKTKQKTLSTKSQHLFPHVDFPSYFNVPVTHIDVSKWYTKPENDQIKSFPGHCTTIHVPWNNDAEKGRTNKLGREYLHLNQQLRPNYQSSFFLFSHIKVSLPLGGDACRPKKLELDPTWLFGFNRNPLVAWCWDEKQVIYWVFLVPWIIVALFPSFLGWSSVAFIHSS
jgi:hypothetical protein